MKRIIRFLSVIIIYFSSPNLFAGDWTFTASGIIEKSGYILPSGNKFDIMNGRYQWTDNLGNYGTSTCKGVVEKSMKGISLNVLCENIDQNNFKFYALYKRKSDDLLAGVGEKKIIDATGPYTFLIGTECNYAITYLDNVAFSSEKCVLDYNVFEKFKNKFK